MTKVVLVDENDKQVGLKDKIEAHLGEGSLHRAFAIIVVNSDEKILIQKRSTNKMLWPLYWDDTCSSHPRENMDYEAEGERRLTEELGFTTKLEIVDKFQYQKRFKEVGSENEVCVFLFGRYDGKVEPNPDEVAEIKWLSVEELVEDMEKNPDIYTYWFKIGLKRLIEKGVFGGGNKNK